MKKILVFFGGRSQEHDISVITGVLTLNSLDKSKYDAVPVYIDKDGLWWTGKGLNDVTRFKSDKIKALERVTLLFGDDTLYKVGKSLKKICVAAGAINCTHGRNGGTVSAVCRLCNIALASPDLFCSALAMDKDVSKKCLAGLGVDTVRGETVGRTEYYSDKKRFLSLVAALGYPVIVKPCSSGSSIGAGVAKDETELCAALDTAFRFDVKVVVEEFMAGYFDVNCACYKVGGKYVVSECERPFGGEFLSFSDKYLGSKTGGGRQFPADIPESVADRIKQTTEKVYSAFGFSGVVRIDYLVSGEKVYLNEINAVPGSLAYYLFCDKISDFKDLLTALIEESFAKNRAYLGSVFAFSSNVLNIDGIKGKK